MTKTFTGTILFKELNLHLLCKAQFLEENSRILTLRLLGLDFEEILELNCNWRSENMDKYNAISDKLKIEDEVISIHGTHMKKKETLALRAYIDGKKDIICRTDLLLT